MAKGFRDLMAAAGFSTQRADQPRNASGYVDDGLGCGSSSDSPGSDRGASCRVLDNNSGLKVKNETGSGGREYNRIPGASVNDIFTVPKVEPHPDSMPEPE